jgi:AraC-like DNA-binding protein
MQASLAIGDYPAADRLDVWHCAAARSFVPLDLVAGEEALRAATMSYQDVGGLRVSDVNAGPGKVIRSPRRIAESDDEFVLLSMQRSGTCVVSQDDRQATVRPGELVCYDTTRPYTLDFLGQFHIALARVPRPLLGVPATLLSLVTARPITAQVGVGRVLAPLLTEVTAHPASYRGLAEHDVGNALIDLTRAAIVERTADQHAPPSSAALLRARILRFVDENLHEPDLSPLRVAQAHGISTRYLHRVFAEAGETYGGCLRQRRLRAAARELRAPYTRNRTIEAVASTCGFRNPAHFSRLFRDAYGVTPRQWRQAR